MNLKKALLFLQFGILITLHSQSKKFSREEYVNKHYKMAVEEMNLYKIPASITLAQGLLETESGNSDLARVANNHFGIKCKRTWEGMKYIKDDDTKDECFRAYSSVEESYRDHSLFLQAERYASLFRFDTKDYKSWAYGLKAAGYATNPNYPVLLIKHIEDLALFQFDNYGTQVEKPIIKIDTSGKDDLNEISSGIVDTHRMRLLTKFTSSEKANNLNFVKVDSNFNILVLSDKTGSPVNYLFKCNDIEGPSQLYPDQNFFLQLKLKSNPLGIHEVKRGETIYEISQMYGVQLAYLKKYNGLGDWQEPMIGEIVYLNKERTTPIRIRTYDEAMNEKKQMAEEIESKKKEFEQEKTTEYFLETATSTTKLPNSDKSIVIHKVKPKETIFKIAKLYDVKPNEILEWNKLTIETGISAGQTLKIITNKDVQNLVQSPPSVTTETISNSKFEESYSAPKPKAPAPPAEAVAKPTPKKVEEASTMPDVIITYPKGSGLEHESTKIPAQKKVESHGKKNNSSSSIENLDELIQKTKTASSDKARSDKSAKKILIIE